MAGRKDIAEMIAVEEGISVNKALRIVSRVFSGIEGMIDDGNNVQIRGFGTFSKVVRKARVKRNPHTGMPINIPERVVTKFKYTP